MSQKVRVIDVADHILQRLGTVSAMKLQKLIYYCQVWSLVWRESPLFSDEIEAWANGPVVRALYRKHSGYFRVGKGFFSGEPERLSDDERDVVEKVLAFYGPKDPQWLRTLPILSLHGKKLDKVYCRVNAATRSFRRKLCSSIIPASKCRFRKSRDSPAQKRRFHSVKSRPVAIPIVSRKRR